jgi:hypothetical protein
MKWSLRLLPILFVLANALNGAAAPKHSDSLVLSMLPHHPDKIGMPRLNEDDIKKMDQHAWHYCERARRLKKAQAGCAAGTLVSLGAHYAQLPALRNVAFLAAAANGAYLVYDACSPIAAPFLTEGHYADLNARYMKGQNVINSETFVEKGQGEYHVVRLGLLQKMLKQYAQATVVECLLESSREEQDEKQETAVRVKKLEAGLRTLSDRFDAVEEAAESAQYRAQLAVKKCAATQSSVNEARGQLGAVLNQVQANMSSCESLSLQMEHFSPGAHKRN